jgi:hypothetical protein
MFRGPGRKRLVLRLGCGKAIDGGAPLVGAIGPSWDGFTGLIDDTAVIVLLWGWGGEFSHDAAGRHDDSGRVGISGTGGAGMNLVLYGSGRGKRGKVVHLGELGKGGRDGGGRINRVLGFNGRAARRDIGEGARGERDGGGGGRLAVGMVVVGEATFEVSHLALV